MKLFTRPGAGVYYVALDDPRTNKRVRLSTRKTNEREARKEAQRILAELQRDAAAARDPVDGREPITLGEAVNLYVENLWWRDRPSAAKVAGRACKLLGRGDRVPKPAHLDPSRPLHTLTPRDLETLGNARRAEGMGPQTIVHELGLLRAATRYAAGLGYREPGALSDGKGSNTWRLPEVVAKTRYLSMDEFWRLYEHLSPKRPIQTSAPQGGHKAAFVPLGKVAAARQDIQDLVVALAFTGGRWNEIAGLRWDQVDLDAGTIRLFGSKTNEARVVGVATQLRDVLERRQAKRGDSPFVFPGRDGERRSTASCQAILKAMNAIGLNRYPDVVAQHGTATVHSLRHTFASTLLQNEASLAEVQDALGHKTLHMTRRYAHLEKSQAARRLGKIMSAAASREPESVPGGGGPKANAG